jgi:hypothetical protein
MEYIVPRNPSYIIDKNRVVRNTRTREILEPVNGKLIIPLDGIIREIDPDWLFWLSYFNLNPNSDIVYDITIYDFMDFNLRSHGANEPKIPVFKEPVYVTNQHRLLPRFPLYAISSDGEIISVENHKLITITKPKNHYSVCRLFDTKNMKFRSQLLHRLVAMAWVENDDYVKKPIVDHIDGNKANNHYKNLRWVSFKKNNKEAVKQGLKNDNLEVKVKDYDTGQVIMFSSVTEACKFMGRSRINRFEDIFLKTPKLTNNRYELKLVTDNTPWNFDDDKKPLDRSNWIKVIRDGVVNWFQTGKELKEEFIPEVKGNISLNDIIKQIKKRHPDIEIIYSNKKTNTYQVRNEDTGEEFEETDRKVIQKVTGLSKSAVQKLITLNGSFVTKGWRIRLKTNKPWPENFNSASNARKEIICTDLNGNEMRFPSLRSVANYLGLDKKTIHKIIKDGSMFRGMRFHYA